MADDKEKSWHGTVEHHENNNIQSVSPDGQDQAVWVLNNYHGDLNWTEEEEKRLVRRIDKKLLPLLFITYALQYYDKAMLSQTVRTLWYLF
jgi:hypothetical protein